MSGSDRCRFPQRLFRSPWHREQSTIICRCLASRRKPSRLRETRFQERLSAQVVELLCGLCLNWTAAWDIYGTAFLRGYDDKKRAELGVRMARARGARYMRFIVGTRTLDCRRWPRSLDLGGSRYEARYAHASSTAVRQ